ncbi:sugar phosphate isomerase/epimerase family protein [Enterococcus sp.]|uniref:sugar phosphate isomerase/epimerase family protein n=1 Tax=Enterococcus sp. TaxID=35783 RepID=UPI00289DC6C8|nr:sugar phosphate isomerase/epimerase family protein [Enterococcus sp.]
MFQYAVRGHDMKNCPTPKDLAQKIAHFQLNNVQFAMTKSFPDIGDLTSMNPGLGTFFKQTFAAEGIQIALLSCYSNLIHPDLEKREALLTRFERYLAHAKYFGAAMVASETGSVLPEMGYTEENFSDAAFEDLVGVIQRLVAYAEKQQVMVGIEAGLNHPLYSLDRIELLLERVPSAYLGIIFDPTNLITSDDYPMQATITEEAFARFGDSIVCLHLKDYRITDSQLQVVPLGEGCIQYQKILDIVARYKPYCYVVLEGTTDAALPRALALLSAYNR